MLTRQQQTFVKLLGKFRFVTSSSLSSVLGIRTDTTYKVLEKLVELRVVAKVSQPGWRMQGRSAYYYLSHPGVTLLRQLLDVKESAVNTLYKNGSVSEDFVNHSLAVLSAYPHLVSHIPKDSRILTRTELSRHPDLPRNRPDLYIRTHGGSEAFIVFAHDMAPYVARKRLDEIVKHSEEEGWESGSYPLVVFVLKDSGSRRRFLSQASRKLDNMGIDGRDLELCAATMPDVMSEQENIWQSVYDPHSDRPLFDKGQSLPALPCQ